MPHGDHLSEEAINHSQPPHQKFIVLRYVIILVILIVALYSIIVLSLFVQTGIREAKRANQRESIKQNLKQIGIALQNYQSQQAEQEQRTQTEVPL